MDQEVVPDMSNPLTRAAERPLDTVRRMSSRVEHSPYRNGLPQDVICESPSLVLNLLFRARRAPSCRPVYAACQVPKRH